MKRGPTYVTKASFSFKIPLGLLARSLSMPPRKVTVQGFSKSSAKTTLPPVPDSQDMFCSAREKNGTTRPSPFFRVTPSVKTAPPVFPVLLMSNGFDRNAARSEAILALRMSANQAARGLCAKDALLKALGREIALKRGDFEPDMIMRDALIEKFLGKPKTV